MNTEEKIIQAAINVFIQKGLHGAKMQHIADEAKINKSLLHYYFRSKEKLYKEVFTSVFSHIFGSLHSIFEQDISFREKLKSFINEYTDLVAKNPHIPLFIIRELGEGGAIGAEVFDKIISDNRLTLPHLFLDSIQKAIEKKEIKSVDPKQLLITILGSCVYFFIAEPLLNVFLNKDPLYKRDVFIEERKVALLSTILEGVKLK